jgi:GGDEF domain-containing protein
MQLKILKLSVEIGRKRNIAQAYLYLGYAYMHLLRFDDAYNAFWESKKCAENMEALIHIAHANKGLGIILIKQKQFQEAFEPLQQSIEIFSQKNMQADLIESSVALASAKLKNDQSIEGYALLTQAITLLDGKDISLRYAGFYRMVAEMHFANKDYQVAYRWGKKHSKVLLDKLDMNKKSSSISQDLSLLFSSQETQIEPIEESKKLAVKLAESSELSISFVGKYQKQRLIIISLLALICLLLITLLGIFFRLRAHKINLAYEEIEKPSYVMASPAQTKSDYQRVFKKARKFQYPLSVGYLVIDNWQELTFHFNNKTINEVTKDIARVINEQIIEFDYAGLLSEGEYLLLFEHQSNQDVSLKLDKLLQAVNSRAFANLGAFSVSMKSGLNAPSFKDIDPYLFLARIAESVNIEQVNSPKVS